jgi:hypothetical protein
MTRSPYAALAARVRRRRLRERRKREWIAALVAAKPITNVVVLARFRRPRRPAAVRQGKLVRVDFTTAPLFPQEGS